MPTQDITVASVLTWIQLLAIKVLEDRARAVCNLCLQEESQFFHLFAATDSAWCNEAGGGHRLCASGCNGNHSSVLD